MARKACRSVTHCNGTHGMREMRAYSTKSNVGARDSSEWNVIHYANNAMLTDGSCAPPWGPGWAFTIPQNYLDVSHENLFSGQLPTRIVIGLVDNRAYNGDRQRNPFNFQHFNMNEIAFGRSATACRNTRSTRLWARTLYKSLQQHVCRKLCKDEGLYISREDYSAGYALCVFDLTADLGEENHYSLVRQEIVRLSLKFWRFDNTISEFWAYFSLRVRRNAYLRASGQKSDHAVRFGDLDYL